MADASVPGRLATGIPGLDTILMGGFLPQGMYLVVGDPGAGKTIFANQLAFAHARTGGQVVYLTMLSETHARLFQHLSVLDFFDHSLVGAQLHYLSAAATLRAEGLEGLLAMLRTEIRTLQPSLLILDGLTLITQAATSPLVLRSFFHNLQTFSEVHGGTILMLTNDAMLPTPPEYTLVDGILCLRMQTIGVRALRELEVTKFRGSGYLRGIHQVTIRDAGLQVHPRLEARLRMPSQLPEPSTTRQSVGIPDLDAMLHGGLYAGSVTLLVGPSGSGKTLLALHGLAAGLQADQPVGYLGFAETPPQLIAKGERFGLGFAAAAQSGRLHLQWVPPTEGHLDVLADELLQLVTTHHLQRLVIDGVGGFQRFGVYPARFPAFFTALFNELRGLGVTTLVAAELPATFAPQVRLPFADLSGLMDNLIQLDARGAGGVAQPVLSIIKVRDSGFDPTPRQLMLTDTGISLGPPLPASDRSR